MRGPISGDLASQIFQCALNVGAGQRLGSLEIARNPSVQQSLVLQVCSMLSAGRFQMFMHIPLAKSLETFDQLCGQGLTGGKNQRHVEIPVAGGNFLQMLACSFVQRSKSLARSVVVGFGCNAGSRGHCFRLDCEAEREDFFSFVRAHWPDKKAAVGMTYQQSVVLQPSQSFTKRNFAHPEIGRKRILTDRLIDRQFAHDDLIPNDIENSVRKVADYDRRFTS